MNKRLFILLGTLGLVLIAFIVDVFDLYPKESPKVDHASDVWAYLALADEVTIYAVDPASDANKYGEGRFTEYKRNYAIKESATITEKSDIIYLASMLMRMDAANSGMEALCFEPRHAIRFNDHWALICFECRHYYSSEGKGHISDFKLRELNHLFEHYGVVPLRSEKGKRPPDFIQTEDMTAKLMRDFLFWFNYDLQSTSESEGVIKESWEGMGSTVNVKYNVVPDEEEGEDD